HEQDITDGTSCHLEKPRPGARPPDGQNDCGGGSICPVEENLSKYAFGDLQVIRNIYLCGYCQLIFQL
ncbi:MAG: hypothetical protein WCB15_04665, partial [Desulfobacterales bacterium]